MRDGRRGGGGGISSIKKVKNHAGNIKVETNVQHYFKTLFD